jgi:hypothetical protein
MSKYMDFTQLGGHPLTQNRLDWLQKGWKEMAIALAKKVAGGRPVILTGMVSSSGIGGATNVSDGFFYYNGDIVRFVAGSYAALTGGNVALLTIATNPVSLTYYDTSTPNVIFETTATVSAAATATDGTHVPLAAMYEERIIGSLGSVDGNTFTFEKSETHFFDFGTGLGIPATSSAALDFTDAKIGERYTGVITGTGSTIVGKSVTFTGTFTDINRNSLPYTIALAGDLIFDIEYLGNIGGVDYVRIGFTNNS